MALLELLGSTALHAFRLAARAWVMIPVVFLYAAGLGLGARLLSPLGMAGGFILGFLEAACISSYLYLLSQAVTGSRLRVADLRKSFTALLWDVVGVLFALWLFSMGVELIARMAGDRGPAVNAIYALAVAVFLNPIPELIYQRRSTGRTTDLLLVSARFIQSNWIEWFLPNLAFGALLLFIAFGPQGLVGRELMVTLPSLFTLQGAYLLAPSLVAGGNSLWQAPLILCLVHFVMVFRGLLFRELNAGSPRSRAYRNRTS
jgi:hypothetical protein